MMEEREHLLGGTENAAEEPQEIVSWYVPKKETGSEVVEYYVQPGPMPGKAAPEASTDAWKEAARQEKKHRRWRLWIFLGCIVGIIAAIVIVGFASDIFGTGKPTPPKEDEDEEGSDNPSSIIDIYEQDDGEKTTIPTVQGDPKVRLTWTKTVGEPLTIQQVYQKVNPSTVAVVTGTKNDGSYVGTGVIITQDGYIVTNAHVISGGNSCRVDFSNGYGLPAKLVGYDAAEDLAVLKVEATGLPAADFGDSDVLQVGDIAYAIGNPLGTELRGTLTNGIISAVNRYISTGPSGESMTMLQTTAALNNGNSGGPLINAWGQVIGINTMKMSNSILFGGEATVEGLGFALPMSHVAEVVNDLIACGEYQGTPTLGITVISGNREDGSPCLTVYDVTEGYGGQQAGIRADDIIVAADGTPVYTTDDLLAVRRQHRIGEAITLTIERDGQTFDAPVMLYSSKKNK